MVVLDKIAWAALALCLIAFWSLGVLVFVQGAMGRIVEQVRDQRTSSEISAVLIGGSLVLVFTAAGYWLTARWLIGWAWPW